MRSAFFENLKAGRAQTVVAYGTSLTHGGGWARAMRAWFEEQFPGLVTFINSGGPGENSDWGLLHVQEKVVAHGPDLVLVEFSYNDAHVKFEMPVERGERNLREMIGVILARNPAVTLVLQTMNVPWDAGNGNRSCSVRPQLDLFNENYRRVSAELSLPLLDHAVAWAHLKAEVPEKFQAWVPDGSHPSEEASLAVTWPRVRAFLERELGSVG